MNELPTTHHAVDDAVAADTTATNRRAQLLSTEHWSLLATRSMSWNEAFSRTGMFLSTLSAATVALALAGPAMEFGTSFPLFALVVLSVTLFLGLATYIRLLQVNNEDLYWVAGMNRIRGAYTKLSPGIEDDFVTGHSLDTDGMARTFGAVDVTSSVSPWHMLVTTPAVVAVISSAIAGVMAGLVAGQLSMAVEVALIAGIGVFLVAVVGLIAYGRREANRYITRVMESRGISTHPSRRSGG
jgi:multidrug transporter EmrE-like cation transporter